MIQDPKSWPPDPDLRAEGVDAASELGARPAAARPGPLRHLTFAPPSQPPPGPLPFYAARDWDPAGAAELAEFGRVYGNCALLTGEWKARCGRGAAGGA